MERRRLEQLSHRHCHALRSDSKPLANALTSTVVNSAWVTENPNNSSVISNKVVTTGIVQSAVTLSPALRIVSAVVASGTNFVLNWASAAGKSYAIDTSTNLLDGFQQTPYSNLQATPDINTKIINVGANPQQFFRVREE